MTKWRFALVAAMLGMFPLAASAADAEKVMADVAAKTKNSLAILTYKVDLPTGAQPVAGQAICVDASGIFITTSMDPSADAKSLKDMELLLPGAEGKTIKAKFMGIDPGSGLGYVQAEENYQWTPVEFLEKPNLAVGQLVVSVGIMGGDGNRTPYLGVANISAILHVPGPLVIVTGGKLTVTCSPVFNAEGKGVGIVARQMPLSWQTDTPEGPRALALKGVEETAFFTPSDEFFTAMKKESMPKDGEIRRLPWIGVNKMEPFDENQAKVENIQLPAIIIDQVIPGEPGDKAGLKNNDVIIAVNGKPLEKLANPAFTVQNFMRQVTKLPLNSKITVTVRRNKENKDFTVTVGPMPKLPNEAERYYDPNIGLLVRAKVELDKYLGKPPISDNDGLIVMGVQEQYAAKGYGLAGGDLIIAVNDQKVTKPDELKGILEAAAKKGDSVKVSFRRAGKLQPESVSIPVIKPK